MELFYPCSDEDKVVPMGVIVSRDAGESAAKHMAEGLRDVGESAARHLAEGFRDAAKELAEGWRYAGVNAAAHLAQGLTNLGNAIALSSLCFSVSLVVAAMIIAAPFIHLSIMMKK